MKQKWTHLLVLAILLIAAGGCGDETSILTEIRPGGSFLRRVRILKYGQELDLNPFPFPQGADWSISRQLQKETGKWTFTSEKSFASSDAFNRETARALPYQLRPLLRVEKRWRFLFTEYTYREILPTVHPFHGLPLWHFFPPADRHLFRKYLSEEYRRLHPQTWEKINQALVKMGEQKGRDWNRILFGWLQRSLAEEFFLCWQKAAPGLVSAGISPESLTIGQDRFLSLFPDPVLDQPLDEVFSRCEQASSIPGLKAALMKNRASFEEFSHRLDVANVSDDAYTFVVTMPGRVISTLGGKVSGRTVSWEMTDTEFYLASVTMQAVSRTFNLTFVLLASGLLLLAILLPCLRLRRKKG